MTAHTSASLLVAHEKLGWPSPEDIFNPSGEGARIFSELARAKIGRALRRHKDASDATVGVLLTDSHATATEPPLAIVVNFPRQATDETLRELQRLAWNFSHSPTVITIEPHLLRVWTCCEPPDSARALGDFVVHELGEADLESSPPITSGATTALHWINLVSGQFFRDRAARFERNRRADQMLLGNLRHVRQKLHQAGLHDDDVCHDLLARIVFVQFLFDRKDSEGNAALTPAKLARLREAGVLRKAHETLFSILGDYRDSYRLFVWLNAKFNGDLFPGKGDTARKRARGWINEKKIVTAQHLAVLAEFIKGDLEMPSGQRCLWPLYAFDVIPLEFISSIYETFVTNRAAQQGIFYTPPHLVDFILDRVLPWDSNEWDLTILDPACGSGIFLVKAFQRLVHRWKRAHPSEQIRVDILRRLLERNIFGVDKDPHAVRVACFSLYLAMCDEIDPRHYWSQVVFPEMRERRLINADFFMDDRDGFRTTFDGGCYDLIIGNAPWGEQLLTKAAQLWAEKHEWPLPNRGIGTLFLAKAARLTKPSGKTAMIQSASSLLFNRSRLASNFRRLFFTTHCVREIVNLSALRFKVFTGKAHAEKTSVAPACIVVFDPSAPDAYDRIAYVSPKQLDQLIEEFNIIIDPQDTKWVSAREAATDPIIWTALMWGNHRDKAFLGRLRACVTLADVGSDVEIRHREGIIFGDRKKLQPSLLGRPIVSGTDFPTGSLLHLDADKLPKNQETYTDSKASTDFEAFSFPQLLIKQGWQKSISRFRAQITRSSRNEGVLCTQSYVSVHVPETHREVIEAACLSLNSMFAAYFLLLTSGRFASYRPEPLVEELLKVPIPKPRAGLLEGLTSWDDVDTRAVQEFEFKDSERVLIEDLFKFTLADFRGDGNSVGRRRTSRKDGLVREPQLTDYCKHFIRVLRAGFGHDKPIAATIFHESDDHLLPYRLVAFELGRAGTEEVSIERLGASGLMEEFDRLNGAWRRTQHAIGRSIYQQRVARVYDHRAGVPTVFVVKPDSNRYWTRTSGLCDGDEVAMDFFRWQNPDARNPDTVEASIR